LTSVLQGASEAYLSQRYLTQKSLNVLRLLSEGGDRRTVYSLQVKQCDIASRLHLTRQALSIHFRRLRELGLIQVGRGFINVTNEGLEALGRNPNPVVMAVRIPCKKRSETIQRIKQIPANQILRVAGDYDVVMVVEQHRMDEVLAMLSEIDGNLEVKSLVPIETLK